jgi:hypothetical protein
MQMLLRCISALIVVLMAFSPSIFATFSTGGGYSVHTQMNASARVSVGGGFSFQSGSAPLNKISTWWLYSIIGWAFRSFYYDIDSDGVPDADELAGLNGGDGNGDGIPDILQHHVATLPGYVTGHVFAFEVISATCNQIGLLNDKTESMMTQQDSGYNYPIGLIDFSLDCALAGDSATVKVYFDAQYATSSWIFRKSDSAGVWSTLSPQPIIGTHTFITWPMTGMTVTTATYSQTDGGINDADATADAKIVDPIGPGVIIVTPPSNTGGWGGGGGGGAGGFTTTIPTLESAPLCSQNKQWNWYRKCALTPIGATFPDFAQNIACEWFIAKRATLAGYEFTKNTPRKEALAIAVKMKKSEGKSISLLSQSQYSGHYDDISKKPPYTDWVPGIVETALANGMISSERKTFEPDRLITRAEAYAMIMSSVCINSNKKWTGVGKQDVSWQQNIHETAKKYGLTTRTWSTFDPETSILRQELMVLASRSADWAEKNGGCDVKPIACQLIEKSPSSIGGF